MKKVLIALNNDGSADKVAQMGFDIAKAMNAEIVVVHVTPESAAYYTSTAFSPVTGFDTFSGVNMIETETLANLSREGEDFLERFKKELGGDAVHTVLRTGDVSDTIVQTATDVQADIIIMGTHNRKGLDKMMAGSVAESVLHHSTIPVLIIPPQST